jgi:hypothetical protein
VTPGERVAQLRDALLALAHVTERTPRDERSPLWGLADWLVDPGRHGAERIGLAAHELRIARNLTLDALLGESELTAARLERAAVARNEAERLCLILAIDSVKVGEARDLIESAGLSADSKEGTPS